MDDPPQSRLFVVCGKSAEAEVLQTAFSPYGCVQNIKIVRDKGVAFVKFSKASTAACAMENLHGVVLNNGRGPKLRVQVAEPVNARSNPEARRRMELELACHPDNIPPRSRLFLVVPKTADGNLIKSDLSKFPALEHCKIDLIQSKGIVFAKFSKASCALKCMEEVNETRMVAGYKVKCMLAEPKSKRARLERIMANSGYGHQRQMDFNLGGLHLGKPRHMPGLGLGGVGALASMTNMNMGSLNSFSGLGKLDSPISPQGALSGLGSLGGIRLGAPGNALGCMGMNTHGAAPIVESHSGLSSGDVSSYTAVDSNLSPTGTLPLYSRQRLYVVVDKRVTEDTLARLFRRFPGMEYCDLKKDRRSGKSKGFAYVNYSTHEAALAAIQHLGGIEFPPHSGVTLRVMFAEILGAKSSSRMPISAMSYSTQTYENSQRFKRSSQDGCEAVLEECEGSVTNGNIHSLGDESHDECKLFFALTRPMPDYSIKHLFSKFGEIDYVHLQQGDSRTGVVKFATIEAARDALQMLNGANVLGETLNVSSSAFPIVSMGDHPSQVAGPVA